jgi:hypothetical protein
MIFIARRKLWRIGRAGRIACEAEDAPDSKFYSNLSAVN